MPAKKKPAIPEGAELEFKTAYVLAVAGAGKYGGPGRPLPATAEAENAEIAWACIVRSLGTK